MVDTKYSNLIINHLAKLIAPTTPEAYLKTVTNPAKDKKLIKAVEEAGFKDIERMDTKTNELDIIKDSASTIKNFINLYVKVYGDTAASHK